MKKILITFLSGVVATTAIAQKDSTVTDKDRKKDVFIQTSMGDMVIRLSDSTPLHRDNFLKLVKVGFYDGILFHRVINQFMIQAGDPDSKTAEPGVMLGNGSPGYTIPAEFVPSLFHKKGVIAAARMGDNVNPNKESSGSQFYIVQGKILTDEELNNIELFRLGGKKIPANQREVYKTLGGTPHLDQNYTVFGELISGLDVLDKIAAVPTNKTTAPDRPETDVKIISATLIKRPKEKKAKN